MRIDRSWRVRRAARRLAAAGLLALAPAVADAAFEDGVAAYQIGDFSRALEIWRPLAEDGDAAAQFNLGIMYRQGEGLSRDYAAARRWFERAARQGNALAMFNIGLMIGSGQGGGTDLVEARRWMLLAAAAAEGESRLESDATYLGDLLRDQLDQEERARSVRRARDWAEANPTAVDIAALPEPQAEPEREPEPRLAPLSADASSIVLDSARPARPDPPPGDPAPAAPGVSPDSAEDGTAGDPTANADGTASAATGSILDLPLADGPARDPIAGTVAPPPALAEGPDAPETEDATPDGGTVTGARVAVAAPDVPAAPTAGADDGSASDLDVAHRVQLASLDSETQALEAWQTYVARHDDLLGDLALHVEAATVDGRRYYRVQAGPLDAAAADGLCRALRERGQDCLFVAP